MRPLLGRAVPAAVACCGIQRGLTRLFVAKRRATCDPCARRQGSGRIDLTVAGMGPKTNSDTLRACSRLRGRVHRSHVCLPLAPIWKLPVRSGRILYQHEFYFDFEVHKEAV